MKYARIKGTCGEGIQLRLLGGSVYLGHGAETTIVAEHLEHDTLKTALRNNDVEVLEIYEKESQAKPFVPPVEEVLEIPAKTATKKKKVEAVAEEAPAPVVEEAPAAEAPAEPAAE